MEVRGVYVVFLYFVEVEKRYIGCVAVLGLFVYFFRMRGWSTNKLRFWSLLKLNEVDE